MPIVGQFGSLAGFGMFPGGALESIATVTVGSGGAANIELTSIPGTYQHLQIRVVSRDNRSGLSFNNVETRFNGDSGSNYADHILFGNGASAASEGYSSQTYMNAVFNTSASATSSIYAVSVIDILDYASTTKNKTVRVIHGADANGSGSIRLRSHLWMSTNAITSIKFVPSTSGSFVEHSTAALYGVKAP